jgi:hypothetical protein
MADHNLFTLKAFRQTAQSHVRWATGSRGSQFMCGTKGGGKPIGLADALPRERTLSGNVDTLEAHRCGLTLSGQRGRGFPHCPYLLSSETTAKGTGLEKLAGKEDPVELDSSLAL